MRTCRLLLLCCLTLAVPAWAQQPAVSVAVMSIELPVEPDADGALAAALAAKIAALRPDVVAVLRAEQQGSAPSAACELARRINYSCSFVTAAPPSHALRQGSALLARHRLLEDGITLLHSPGPYSAAGMVRLQLDGQPLNVYVAQVTEDTVDPADRAQQLDDLRRWIEATDDHLPSLVAGRFALEGPTLVRHLPGFQPAGTNPRRDAASATRTPLEVLYRVRQFADVSQRLLAIPHPDGSRSGVLGSLAVLRLLPSAANPAPATPR